MEISGLMDNMFDDLLGNSEETAELPPAPYGKEDFSLKFVDVHQVERGVTVPWLSQAFAVPRGQVEAMLRGCPAIRSNRGSKVYDLRTAAGYLVKPKFDIATYIKNLDPKDLPEKLKREFWAARLNEQRWRKTAGELWASEDVIALYSELFKLIKSTSLLWEDRVSRADKLSDAQRETLVELKDDLLTQIHNIVEELAAGRMTASSIAEADNDESEE